VRLEAREDVVRVRAEVERERSALSEELLRRMKEAYK
jgi:hypothetical protein